MKMTKMALLAGAALAVTTAGAKADDLDALKAQIESLNARVAAMETAPSVPTGYQLIAVSEGELQAAPGLGLTARERAAFGSKSTIISVLPTADAPAGTTISWSGYARAGVVYTETSNQLNRTVSGGSVVVDTDTGGTIGNSPGAKSTSDDIDVLARGQIRVKAATDTAVGEVGVDVRVRGNFNGGGDADALVDVAWGYWSMTPELTLGGGYAGSLGNIGYGMDGACTCHYTSTVDLNPGDTTQLRLSYASGPISFAVALEDGSKRLGASEFGAKDAAVNGDKLGAAGEIKYSGDMISGEISGVWRETAGSTGADALWQVGAGLSIGLGDMASLSVGAAMGKGPESFTAADFSASDLTLATRAGEQNWWAATALASVNLSDEIHAELGVGYKVTEGDDFSVTTGGTAGPVTWTTDGTEAKTLAVLAGIYYNPVDQLTIGVEGSWSKTDTELGLASGGSSISLDRESESKTIDLVTVWRF